VPVCDLVWMRSTAFRLIRKARRNLEGTLCTVGDDSYLFTSGYVPWWMSIPVPYPGAAADRLMWTDRYPRAGARNSGPNENELEFERGIGRHPITISFARKVGTLMTELSDNQVPNPSYRFYM